MRRTRLRPMHTVMATLLCIMPPRRLSRKGRGTSGTGYAWRALVTVGAPSLPSVAALALLPGAKSVIEAENVKLKASHKRSTRCSRTNQRLQVSAAISATKGSWSKSIVRLAAFLLPTIIYWVYGEEKAFWYSCFGGAFFVFFFSGAWYRFRLHRAHCGIEISGSELPTDCLRLLGNDRCR
jgi:hypothetical protein